MFSKPFFGTVSPCEPNELQLFLVPNNKNITSTISSPIFCIGFTTLHLHGVNCFAIGSLMDRWILDWSLCQQTYTNINLYRVSLYLESGSPFNPLLSWSYQGGGDEDCLKENNICNVPWSINLNHMNLASRAPTFFTGETSPNSANQCSMQITCTWS